MNTLKKRVVPRVYSRLISGRETDNKIKRRKVAIYFKKVERNELTYVISILFEILFPCTCLQLYYICNCFDMHDDGLYVYFRSFCTIKMCIYCLLIDDTIYICSSTWINSFVQIHYLYKYKMYSCDFVIIAFIVFPIVHFFLKSFEYSNANIIRYTTSIIIIVYYNEL